jgi:hypothetical protein
MKVPHPVATPRLEPTDRASGGTTWRMATVILVLLLAAGVSLPAMAQAIPRVQVFGGYSYTRFDTKSFGFSDQTGLNGYNFSPAFNIVRGFGAVAELSGQYQSQTNLRDIAAGPQFMYPTGQKLFFVHFLFGQARTFVRVGNGEGDSARAVAFGGGMDWDVSPRFAVRVFQVDYLHTDLFQTTQNNLRFSAGLVYHWGSIGKKGRRAPAQTP